MGIEDGEGRDEGLGPDEEKEARQAETEANLQGGSDVPPLEETIEDITHPERTEDDPGESGEYYGVKPDKVEADEVGRPVPPEDAPADPDTPER